MSTVTRGLSIAVASLLGVSANAAITLKFFPASTYNTNVAAMNAALGITHDTIDDFSTAAFPAGLTMVLSGNGQATTTWDALPGLFNQNTLPADCYNFGDIPNLGIASWTGAYAATNIVTNSLPNASCLADDTLLAQAVEFNVAPGASAFGVGFANFQSLDSPEYPVNNHELFINGVDMGVLETLAGANWTPGITLNAYLLIDATEGDVISSVVIENLQASNDFLGFSDLALKLLVAPTESPVIAGTLGRNGWYTSDVILSWDVAGTPKPTTSGCGKATVGNTKGSTHTCTATNSVGSSQQAVTIKVDTGAPTAKIRKPASNAVYGLNAVQFASYSCADATSGVASCSGTVADGAHIPTGTAGVQTFTVVAIDNAGNTSTETVSYTVK